ncbi:hypothetical protein [Arthrobacter sp. M4]|uniref:hypothetical protein n=1 Tax=Arthrobacter sp. M4 TaxID=218160 RepID=UPI001CDCA11B|nr:hypothetical protein [Arthrobacter sp. M4]MCA4134734.1 hypothetical protein [Arthrobacter sp. M4]
MALEDPNTPTPSDSSTSGAERRDVVVRRAPRFVPFMILGGIIGIILAAFVAYGLPGDPSFERSAVFGFFTVGFAAAGVILGSVAALILDRVSVRRAERAVVEEVPDEEPHDSDD